MTLLEFVARLENSRRKVFSNGFEGYVASCPCLKHSHGDKSRSLAVWPDPDKPYIKLRCAGGCTEAEILASLGLAESDLKQDTAPSNEPSAVYTYTDAKGNYLFEKARYYQYGKKTFKLRVKNGTGYVYSIAHIKGWSNTLYRLPEVIKAIDEGTTVYVNEGEKACDLMVSKGLVATCQPCGADGANPGAKWTSAHTMALQGANVVVVADRDEVGLCYGRYVAKELAGIAKSVKLVQSAYDREKADAWDHLQAGYGPEDFVEIEISPKRKAAASFGSITKRDVEWLWKPYIPLGGVTMLSGDPGIGKSSFAYALASWVSCGTPNGIMPAMKPAQVLLYCLEDSSERVILRKLEENGADLLNIYTGVLDENYAPDGIEPPMTVEKMRQVVETAKELPDVKLIVFDPIVEWFPPNKSMISGNETREILKMFRSMAEELNCAVLLLSHPNKNSAAGHIMYRVSGSLDFSAIVRSGLYAGWAGGQENANGDRAVVHYKANWGPLGKAVGYQILGDGAIALSGFMEGGTKVLSDPQTSQPQETQQPPPRWAGIEDPFEIP